MSQICSHIFPATICLAAPETMFSFVGTTSNSEMVAEVCHPELHQDISNLLTARILGLGVDVESNHMYSVIWNQSCILL